MQFVDTREGNVFNVPFASQTLSTAGTWDLYTITAPAASRVQLLDIELGQQSTAPANIQALGVGFFIGTTSTGTGTGITAVNTKRWTGAPTAGTSVTGPTTSTASTASAAIALIYANAFEAASGKFSYRPNEEYGVPIVVSNNQRLFIRVSQPQLAVVLSGTLTFKEIGYGAPA